MKMKKQSPRPVKIKLKKEIDKKLMLNDNCYLLFSGKKIGYLFWNLILL